MSLLRRLANQLCVNSSLSDTCKGFTWSVCRSLFITWKQFQKPHVMYPNHYFGQPDHLIHLSEWLKTIPAFWKLSIGKQSKTKKSTKLELYPTVCLQKNNDIGSKICPLPLWHLLPKIPDMLAGQIIDNFTLLEKLFKLLFFLFNFHHIFYHKHITKPKHVRELSLYLKYLFYSVVEMPFFFLDKTQCCFLLFFSFIRGEEGVIFLLFALGFFGVF